MSRTIGNLQGIKAVNSFETLSLEKRTLLGLFAHTGLSKKCFSKFSHPGTQRLATA
jgi:hypothetical protein